MYHNVVSRLRTFGCTLRDFAPMLLAAIALGLVAGPALAELPTVVTPEGAASGDYLAVAGDYIKKGLLLLGLVVVGAGFLFVAGGALGKFNEYRIGKAEIGTVGAYAVLGGVILLIIVYLVTESSTVM